MYFKLTPVCFFSAQAKMSSTSDLLKVSASLTAWAPEAAWAARKEPIAAPATLPNALTIAGATAIGVERYRGS